MTKAIQQYSKAIEVGDEVRRHELAVQQENMLNTKRMNESTEKLNDVRRRREAVGT
jgi:hypothetical protein